MSLPNSVRRCGTNPLLEHGIRCVCSDDGGVHARLSCSLAASVASVAIRATYTYTFVGYATFNISDFVCRLGFLDCCVLVDTAAALAGLVDKALLDWPF